MLKLWNNYSYVIILIIFSCLAALFISFKYDAVNKEEFLKVTVAEGDSLWEIADNYASQHNLNKEQFVQWVKKNNEIPDNQIFPGDEILIPVSLKDAKTEYAGVMEEN